MHLFRILQLRCGQHGILHGHRVEQRERLAPLVVVVGLQNHPVETKAVHVIDRRGEFLVLTGKTHAHSRGQENVAVLQRLRSLSKLRVKSKRKHDVVLPVIAHVDELQVLLHHSLFLLVPTR